ncbi:hypothetical protein NO357_18395 [Marimonas arenosa]|uniref:Uncharacterized protein n=1 Tax=Marimonas arenosa TaxID=1795305 RepID=A0AAE3WHF5_9RHOB|nr:hypothetical protein [Marimonas arenosa]
MIERAHRRAPKGRGQIVGPDGLLVVRKRRSAPAISPRGVLYLLFGFILFKSIALAQFGESGYMERINGLQSGTLVEKAGALVMQPDRFSIGLAKQIAPFIR